VARIELTTEISAPIERCFDLSRSIDLHVRSTAHTGERAIAGVTRGLISLNEQVTWRAKHFGVWQELTSKITAFDRPHYFRDEMQRGAFKRFVHDHHFVARAGGTTMRDALEFDAPLSLFGRLAERVFLTRYLRSFLVERNAVIKRAAEGDEWREVLPV
jgi:ligand-binding SRPBCC domain-containing protein